MAFFVIGRARPDGTLRLLDAEVHGTREEAARSVQALAMAGAVSVDDVDVYIADLSAASSVVVVGVPAQAEVSAAGVWEAPAAAIVHDLPAPDAGDVMLADALQRAATRLESEGIVAPESVGFDFTPVPAEELEVSPETEPEPVPVFEPEPEVESEPLSVSDPEPELPAEAVFEPEPETETELEAEPEQELEPEPAIALEVDPEPEAYADLNLSAVIASLGSLNAEAVVSEPEAEESAEPESPAGEEWPWLNVGEVTPEVLEAESDEKLMAEVAEPDVIDEPVAAIEEPVEEFAPEVAPLPEVAEPASAYAPAGDLSLEAYTCADCIYSNTCPKVNETAPADCGAFQWKAV